MNDGVYWACSAYKKCSECGDEKYIDDTRRWVYKITQYSKTKWFCSWRCLCAYRRVHEQPWKPESEKVRTPPHNVGTYPNILKEIREYFGLQQIEVAEYIGCGKATYNKIERGVSKIMPQKAAKLSRAYGCKAEDLTAPHFDEAAAEDWDCLIKKKRTDSPR